MVKKYIEHNIKVPKVNIYVITLVLKLSIKCPLNLSHYLLTGNLIFNHHNLTNLVRCYIIQ